MVKLYYTKEARDKTLWLLENFDSEVAWHGVAKRYGEDEENYIIEDIVVYPQTVSGATVEMDENEYAKWLMENDEDERFSNLRMQGHSHVNMGVFPSGTDQDHREKIKQMLKPDGFYIFAILNKKLDLECTIYDKDKIETFHTEEIEPVLIVDEPSTGFIEDAKAKVKETEVESKWIYQKAMNFSNPKLYKVPSTSSDVDLWEEPLQSKWSGWEW